MTKPDQNPPPRTMSKEIERITFMLDSVLPCPFCGERLVIHSDHHGEWVAHRDEPGPCIFSVVQLMDAKDRDDWNRRSTDQSTAAMRDELEAVIDRANQAAALFHATKFERDNALQQLADQSAKMEEMEVGEATAREAFVAIFVAAIGGMADAVIVAHQQYGMEHVLAAVQQLAGMHKDALTQITALESQAGAIREALAAMLDEHDGICDCRPEPENRGHVCNLCKSRHALSSQAGADLLKRVQALEAISGAAKTLTEKMTRIHASPEYISVWQMYHIHGGQYSGDSYEMEFKALAAALSQEQATPRTG